MTGTRTLTTMVLGIALIGSAAPASAGAAAYRHYVGCGLSEKAKPSHSCPAKSKKGAFFKSTKADVFYKVCVKFPTGKRLCAPPEEATRRTLYVNEITSNIPGKHKVTWFVAGKRVGVFIFDVPG